MGCMVLCRAFHIVPEQGQERMGLRMDPFSGPETVPSGMFQLYINGFHTGCLRDRDQEMDEWVLWFCVEPFILHLNRDKEEWVIYQFFRS